MPVVTAETQTDWAAWARREASAFLAQYPNLMLGSSRDDAIAALAAMWLQGVNLGAHETLHAAEEALQTSLA